MVIMLMFVAGMAAVLAIAIVPFLLPWPQHLRWLVASTTIPDPTGMSIAPGPMSMREVTVGDVHRSAERVVVQLIETSHVCPSSSYVLSASTTTRHAAARLEYWSAAHTPVLLIEDHDGEVSLHGPSHAVVGLRRAALSADSAQPERHAVGSSDLTHHWAPRVAPVLVAR